VWKLLKWFDVGKDWKLGIDRYIKFCCVMVMVNWFLDLLHALPVEDAKALINAINSQLPI
jgi:hypothetical protein